jgi:hypothetical protein
VVEKYVMRVAGGEDGRGGKGHFQREGSTQAGRLFAATGEAAQAVGSPTPRIYEGLIWAASIQEALEGDCWSFPKAV